MNQTIQLHSKDNVVIARSDLAEGETVTNEVKTRGVIAFGHKVAVRDISAGAAIVKYGQNIGRASKDIASGEHVHIHNMSYSGSESVAVATNQSASCSTPENATFQGYVRSNGKVGTRNYIGVMATVNCAATVVSRVARLLESDPVLEHPGVDGVIPIVHQSGCGIPAAGQGELGLLQRLLRGYLNHPNFYGWVIVGLGCEVNQISSLLQQSGNQPASNIRTVVIQDVGGTADAIQQGLLAAKELVEQAKQCVRETQPASKLVLGLQCGGSDAWSGVTANPGLGAASDLVVSVGGTAILAETPEIYGAEALLYQRCRNDKVKARLEQKINWWQDYLARANTDFNNNPSPGNLKSGISTILEKSLGAVAKGGQSQVQEVLDYAQPVTQSGLVFMDSPGYDPCSVTGEVASGANLVCFTTGRGSTFGAAGVPCIKLASNDQLYQRMKSDMDVNCGTILETNVSISEMGEQIFATLLRVASGEPTKSEQLGLGYYEFVPWHQGVNV